MEGAKTCGEHKTSSEDGEAMNAVPRKKSRLSQIRRSVSNKKFSIFSGPHELSSIISQDMPPNERLSSLVKQCAVYSLEQCLADKEYADSMGEIMSAYKLALDRILNEKGAKDICKEVATSLPEKPGLLITAAEIEEYNKEIQVDIERLTKESERWEDVLRLHSQEPNHMEASEACLNDSKTLNNSNTVEPNSMMLELSERKHRLNTQVKVLLQATTALNHVNKAVDERLSKFSEHIDNHGVGALHDGKQLVKTVLES